MTEPRKRLKSVLRALKIAAIPFAFALAFLDPLFTWWETGDMDFETFSKASILVLCLAGLLALGIAAFGLWTLYKRLSGRSRAS